MSKEYDPPCLPDRPTSHAQSAACGAGAARETTGSTRVAADLRLADFVMENGSVGVFVGTRDGRIIRVNKRACQMSGYEREELIGMSVTDLDPGFRAEKYEAAIAHLRDTKTEVVETHHRHKDGHMYPVEVSTNLLEFEGTDYVISCVRDMTERHQAELQKAHLETQLAQAQKMEALGLLAAGIAHDFNNSLTVILGYAALLSSAEKPETREYDALRRITEAATRSKNLVSQLLGFSRQQLVSPQPMDLNLVLEESQDILKRLAGEDIEMAILPGRSLGKVLLDRTQIDQVVMNLVANARDAMPNGGKLTLETTNAIIDEAYAIKNPPAQAGEYVVLAASDTGIGMDAETAVAAFEPFFTTKEKGTGLGLATVFGIVRQNRGFIHVYSEPGQGTTFRIYFPRLAGEGEEEITEKKEAGMPEPPQAAKGTILLVEDDELVRNMTVDAIEFLGYTPKAAAGAKEAIAICQDLKTPIDLVISDVVMPEMKGTELRDRLQEIRPGLRVLFVSGYTSNVVIRHDVLRPDVHFLPKPFNIDELAAKIREVMGGETAGLAGSGK